MCVHTCICAYGDQRSTSIVILQVLSILFLRQSLYGVKPMNNLLPLCSQNWDDTCSCAQIVFMLVLRFSVVSKQTFYWLSHLHSLIRLCPNIIAAKLVFYVLCG